MRRITDRAFSLIEVIAAIVILEVIVVSVLGMYATGNQSSMLNEDRLLANNLLRMKIEEIKTKPFSQNVTETMSYTGYDDYAFSVAQTLNYGGNAFLKRVDVSMIWTSPLGINKQEDVILLVADY